ncbi:MAG: type II secretion system F family protein, partial [Actinomycetes bacterium]
KYLERDLEARRKIKAALIYPSVVAGTSLVTIVVLSLFVLPKFKNFFASLDAKLPLPTRMLLGLTDFMGTWWWAIIGGTTLLALAAYGVTRTVRGKLTRDTLLLKAPVLGETIRYALVERFCRVFASMVNAGVTLPEAMRVATESMRNVVFVNALTKARLAMMQGDGIAGPMALTQLFPGTAVQMMRVGEDTGTLDAQLEVAAQYYEQELDYKVKRLTTLFEPAVILFMGAIVGFVAIALVSAMYGIFRQVKV